MKFVKAVACLSFMGQKKEQKEMTPYGKNAVCCLKNGEYVQELTLKEAIAQASEYANLVRVTKDEAIEYSEKLFPTLKR